MKHLSLTENHLFSKTYSGGTRFSGRYVSVFVLRDKAARRLMKENPEKQYLNRLGISTSKRIGGAVVRSRARRVIREGFRAVENEGIKTGYLIVISARDGIVNAKSEDLRRELKYAFGKLGLLLPSEQS